MSVNSIPQAPEKSPLETLYAEFEAKFQGKTTKKRTDELVSAYQAAIKARAVAEIQVEKAAKAESDAATAIIREVSGRKTVTIGGQRCKPMSRGDRVFFRKESAETLDLG